MPRTRRAEEGDNNAWMSTFSDLLMLMLTFFVLLLTMSSMDAKEVEQIRADGLQVLSGSDAQTHEIAPGMDLPKISPQPAIAIKKELLTAPFGAISTKYADVSETLLTRLGLQGNGWITRTPDGLEVNLDGRIAFDPHTPHPTPAAKRFLAEFAQMLEPSRVEVSVVTHVGHDSKSLVIRQDSLTLALLRADAIASLLMAQGLPKEALEIAGLAQKAGDQAGDFLRYSELLTLKIRVKPHKENPATSR